MLVEAPELIMWFTERSVTREAHAVQGWFNIDLDYGWPVFLVALNDCYARDSENRGDGADRGGKFDGASLRVVTTGK